ncbi:hypothetical protein [Bradyrhizobium sp. 6(2017)]|uniref:hypothetical protein n=1 Tax=Bradyrhizobium sp. 6(2017) TaxID=1197460 RepID=UPI002FE5F8E4
MEEKDRKKVDAAIAETFWHGVERHLVRGGFTGSQAQEVVHIMAYMMPQYVREQTDALGDKIAKRFTEEVGRLRTEIGKDNAELRATLSDKNSVRMQWIIGILIAVLSSIVTLVVRSLLH